MSHIVAAPSAKKKNGKRIALLGFPRGRFRPVGWSVGFDAGTSVTVGCDVAVVGVTVGVNELEP